MKKLLSTVLLSSLVLGFTACGSTSYDVAESGSWKDGTYSQDAEGYGDPFTVTITIKDGKMTTLDIGENNETPNHGDLAINQLPQTIIDAQTYDVDTVSSATITSNAIIDATARCLEEASQK